MIKITDIALPLFVNSIKDQIFFLLSPERSHISGTEEADFWDENLYSLQDKYRQDSQMLLTIIDQYLNEEACTYTVRKKFTLEVAWQLFFGWKCLICKDYSYQIYSNRFRAMVRQRKASLEEIARQTEIQLLCWIAFMWGMGSIPLKRCN